MVCFQITFSTATKCKPAHQFQEGNLRGNMSHSHSKNEFLVCCVPWDVLCPKTFPGSKLTGQVSAKSSSLPQSRRISVCWVQPCSQKSSRSNVKTCRIKNQFSKASLSPQRHVFNQWSLPTLCASSWIRDKNEQGRPAPAWGLWNSRGREWSSLVPPHDMRVYTKMWYCRSFVWVT